MLFGFYDFIADVCVGVGTEELVDVVALFGMQVMTIPFLLHLLFP